MRPDESFVGNSVRSLQTMLRVIAADENRSISVIPDGIYGQDTLSEVAYFQRRAGLQPTGVTDQATWEAIVAAYEPALIRVGPPQPLLIVMEPGEVIYPGMGHPNVYLAQAILTVLSQQYPGITEPGITGIIDLPTERSLSSFQELNLLPVTGALDRETWKSLALHYPMAAVFQARNGNTGKNCGQTMINSENFC